LCGKVRPGDTFGNFSDEYLEHRIFSLSNLPDVDDNDNDKDREDSNVEEELIFLL
jgi:hypothetical protein